MTDTDLTTALDTGVAAADPARASEAADVQRWFKRIQHARKHDEPARKQYATDRRYARGDTGAEVAANLLGTYIDILKAFLYAKDPDVDVLPAKSVEPPSMEAMRDAAEASIRQSPEVQQAASMALQLATTARTLDPTVNPQAVAEQAAAAKTEQLIQEQFKALQDAYAQRQRDNKAFAETLELVISRLWQQARLKVRGRMGVQSALSVAVGWLKASWQERKGYDPLVLQKIADLRDNIAKAAKLREDMEEQSGAELDATTAEYRRQIEALQGEAERVIARGFAVDFVEAENIQVAPGVTLENYLDAPWIGHKIPMRKADAQAEFKLDRDTIAKAVCYHERKPVMAMEDSPAVRQPDAEDADRFAKGEGQEEGGDPWVMVWEVWDRDSNSILTGIEGIPRWVRPKATPCATTRFYSFFLLAYGTIDGQRHPQSYTSRSAKLIDEYNRIGSAEAEHRRRVRPKTAFNAGLMDEAEAKKLAKADTQEMVALKFANPQTDIRTALLPVAYAALDPALYDRARIVQELERIWGVQEALQGAINTAKTATEAQIQQTGMQARTGAQRDAMEDVLAELALYTAEVALHYLSDEDARAIAGPNAMWPDLSGPEDLAQLVNVEIRAGSSGKPNTTAERQAWSTLLPMLQNGVMQIAQLRQSSPVDVADAVENLLRMTVERAGDRLDVDSLLPPAGPAQPMVPGMPGQPMPGAPAADPAAAGAPAEPNPAPMAQQEPT